MGDIETNSKCTFNFQDKNSLIPIFDTFHDCNCRFKILDNSKLGIFIDIKNQKSPKISITFTSNVLDSFTIYNFINDNGKFLGEIIDNNQAKDLEKLFVELIDCLFTNLDLVLFSIDANNKNMVIE